MKASEIHELSAEDLAGKLKDARAELFNLRFRAATGQLENPSSIKDVKKDMARVKTIIREREIKQAQA